MAKGRDRQARPAMEKLRRKNRSLLKRLHPRWVAGRRFDVNARCGSFASQRAGVGKRQPHDYAQVFLVCVTYFAAFLQDLMLQFGLGLSDAANFGEKHAVPQ